MERIEIYHKAAEIAFGHKLGPAPAFYGAAEGSEDAEWHRLCSELHCLKLSRHLGWPDPAKNEERVWAFIRKHIPEEESWIDSCSTQGG